MRALQILKKWLPVDSFSRSARLFLLATLVDGIIFSAWNLFFNFFILARGYQKDFLGLVNSLPSVAALLLAIPLGILSDRIGRRRAMLIGLVINTAAMGLQVTVNHPTMLLAMVFIGGVGSNLYYISQAPFMMSVSDDRSRAALFSLNFGLVTLSGAVGNLFAGQLPVFFSQTLHVQPDSATAYQAVLLCAVALGSLSLLPIYLIHEPAAARKALAEKRQPIGKVLARPVLWKLVIPNTLIGFGAAILIPYANVFFAERFQLSDHRLGLLFSLSSLLTGIGCVVGPRLAEYLKSKIRAVVLTQGGSIGFLVLLGFTPFSWLAELSFLVRGTLMNMSNPLYTAFAMEQFPEEDQGVANSVINTAWTAGWAVGPYLSGLVQLQYGFQPLFVTTSILYATAILLTWVFFGRSKEMDRPVIGYREELVGEVGD